MTDEQMLNGFAEMMKSFWNNQDLKVPNLETPCKQEPCGDIINRRAVEHLDWFTKLYCRDKSITDDLAFRCEQCEFEIPDGGCLVKIMARKLCPDYRDFGSMGDL